MDLETSKLQVQHPNSHEEQNIIYQYYHDPSNFEKIIFKTKRKELTTHGGHYMHQSKRKDPKCFSLTTAS